MYIQLQTRQLCRQTKNLSGKYHDIRPFVNLIKPLVLMLCNFAPMLEKPAGVKTYNHIAFWPSFLYSIGGLQA
ncbi:MAG: hypothetical protein KJP07_06075, partial [Desulfatitalea sp.]|nr:hypothetical protein [Desulfatitalea sp.]